MNDHSYKLPLFCQLPNSNLSTMPLHAFERDASSEPMAPGSILPSIQKLLQLLFYFLLLSCRFALSLFAFNLVASKNKGSDDPLAFVGCKQIICLCAGTAKVVSLVTPSGSINLGS